MRRASWCVIPILSTTGTLPSPSVLTSASMAASAIKHRLHYFHLSSRGELIRLVYAYGRVPLEEVTVPMGRKLMELKPTYPFQQLPVVEIEGKKYAQSTAIARFMAKQVGLYPMNDHLAALEVDMVVETTADMLYAVIEKNFLERDAERKAKQTAKLNKYVLPAYLHGLHSRVPEKKGYILGDQISLADLAVFHIVENVLLAEKERFPLEVESKYPKLLDIVSNVKAEPSIAAYLADEKNHRPIVPSW